MTREDFNNSQARSDANGAKLALIFLALIAVVAVLVA